MSAYGSLKHSLRSRNAYSPLPLLLDFLAPSWATTGSSSSYTEEAFFEPSFKPVFNLSHHFSSPPNTDDALLQSAPEVDAPVSNSRSTYRNIVSIRQAVPVAFTGYTSANYGLASPEWTSSCPPSRVFAWRSQPGSPTNVLVPQRPMTTLPQTTSQDHRHQSTEETTNASPRMAKPALTPIEALRDKVATLELAIQKASWDQSRVEQEWTRLLTLFWQHRMYRRPEQVLWFATILLRHQLLLEAWDVRKVFLRWSKSQNIEPEEPMHQVLDGIRDASLRWTPVRRQSVRQKTHSQLSRLAWLELSGMKYSPTLHRILLDKSTFQKAFFAFRYIWPPTRTLEDYEEFVVAACRVEDSQAVELLWSELSASPSLTPTYRIYRHMISHFSRRRDPDSVDTLIRSMQEKGVKTTRHQWTDLMRAHVAGANWQAVSQTFKHMEASPHERERPDIVAINVVLRAELLAGAPFHIIRSLVASLPSRGYKPDHLTMAILMESAVDLGLLGPAETIFAQMDASPHLQPNVVHFGIMIKAYLLRGHSEAAQDYLDEMLKRGISASAVIYAQIISAYLSRASKSQEDEALSFQSAEEFAKDFERQQQELQPHVQENRTRPRGGDQSYSSVMVPLIASFARTFQPKLSLAYFSKIMQAQQLPNQVAYATLLDAYRRVGDVSAMKEVWQGLYERALQDTASLGRSGDGRVRGRANYLCLPLSTMIHGLSAGGQFEALSDIWQQMHGDGFGFDCSNWNHLCQALLGGDQWQSACTIAERVLLTPETPQGRSGDILGATRVRPDAETPSRSHQERSSERERERRNESYTARQLNDEDRRGNRGGAERPFLDAFSGAFESQFWRLQQKSKEAFLAERDRRFRRAAGSEKDLWEEQHPRLARVLRQHQLQKESESANAA